MIVSLHTPKAGGSSFKLILEKEFGDKLLSDYKDIPINKPVEERLADVKRNRLVNYLYRNKWNSLRGIECIHGHFLPYKYIDLAKKDSVSFITWFRDPLERLGSHYYYWQRAYNPKKSAPLHKKVVEEEWSFEAFCFSEEMRNFYSKFLWSFPIEKFAFIGIVEHYTDDVVFFFNKFLKKDVVEIPKVNVNNNIETYINDTTLKQELKKFHAEDYKMYEYALEKREERLNKTL